MLSASYWTTSRTRRCLYINRMETGISILIFENKCDALLQLVLPMQGIESRFHHLETRRLVTNWIGNKDYSGSTPRRDRVGVQKLDILALLCQIMYLISIILSIVLVCCLYLLTYLPDQIVRGQNATNPAPLVRDSDLKVELVAKHFNFPTAIDFLGNDDLLIAEKILVMYMK